MPDQRLCAMKIGGWAPHELHEHEAEEVARDQAEGVRLAYVAATRARDLLVVPALGDEPWEGGWFGPLNRALYPRAGVAPERGARSECPAFKSKDSVLQRPNDEPAGPHGLPGPARVRRWVFGRLVGSGRARTRREAALRRAPRGSDRQGRAPDVVADGRSRYDRWRLARTTRARPARRRRSPWRRCASGRQTRRIRCRPAPRRSRSRRLMSKAASTPGPMVPAGGVRRARPRGPRAGAVRRRARVLDTIARVEARVLGLGEPTRWRPRDRRSRLQHDLLGRARAAATAARAAAKRRSPDAADGTLVEGVVDLAFEEEAAGWSWTTRPIVSSPAGEERYRRQVALYASAIAHATGSRAEASSCAYNQWIDCSEGR